MQVRLLLEEQSDQLQGAARSGSSLISVCYSIYIFLRHYNYINIHVGCLQQNYWMSENLGLQWQLFSKVIGHRKILVFSGYFFHCIIYKCYLSVVRTTLPFGAPLDWDDIFISKLNM